MIDKKILIDMMAGGADPARAYSSGLPKTLGKHAEKIASIAEKKPGVILDHIGRAFDDLTAADLKDYRERLKEVGSAGQIALYPYNRLGFVNLCLTCISAANYLGLLFHSAEKNGVSPDGYLSKVAEFAQKRAAAVFPLEGQTHGITLQGAVINQIRQTGKRTGSNLAKENTLFFTGENVSLAFFRSDKYKGVAMTTQMHKVNSMLHEELCRKLPANLEALGRVQLDELNKYQRVQITLDRYMELTGTKDKKTARQAIKEACDRLYHVSFVVDVGGKHFEGRLFETQGETARGGVFYMDFTVRYLRYCSTTSPAAFHYGMYRINGNNNPYAWGIGQKLWQHFMQTRGRAGSARLSIKKLIEAVPDIPRYSEVMDGAGAVNRRIIEPVERDLDELQRLGVLKSWEYSNGKGVPLSDEQLGQKDYKTWERLYISFVLNLPSQAPLIEAHKKRIEAARRKSSRKRTAKK